MHGSHAPAQRDGHITAGVVAHMQHIGRIHLLFAQHDVKKGTGVAFAGLVFCRDVDGLHSRKTFFMQHLEQERGRQVHIADSDDAFAGSPGCATQLEHAGAWLQQGTLAQHLFMLQARGRFGGKAVPALDMGIDVVQCGVRIPQLFFRMPAQCHEIQVELLIDPGGDEMEDVPWIVDDRTGQQGIEDVEAQDPHGGGLHHADKRILAQGRQGRRRRQRAGRIGRGQGSGEDAKPALQRPQADPQGGPRHGLQVPAVRCLDACPHGIENYQVEQPAAFPDEQGTRLDDLAEKIPGAQTQRGEPFPPENDEGGGQKTKGRHDAMEHMIYLWDPVCRNSLPWLVPVMDTVISARGFPGRC